MLAINSASFLRSQHNVYLFSLMKDSYIRHMDHHITMNIRRQFGLLQFVSNLETFEFCGVEMLLTPVWLPFR